QTFSRRLVAAKPGSIVLISPHSPMESECFLARGTRTLSGDFREFRAGGVSLTFNNDLDLLNEIELAAAERGLMMQRLTRSCPLDHGALVPLYYLAEAGWAGPIVVIGFTRQSNERHLAFGQAITAAARKMNRGIALVASGDLSHRLIVGGPYAYEPDAHLFDEQIVGAISEGNADAVLDLDPELRECAGECGYRSIIIALGSVGEAMAGNSRVLSYEGPFGVGYMVALLLPDTLSPGAAGAALNDDGKP
ncbi:MAG TPA: class III extradiol dioxygenase subunit B-like domain-containing protein, partial [Blastocatellia bacterium]|nr:class III extradiol dioxygenase subunit B-like domain-containing protein [Blastocatellia bacterium]